MVDGKSDVTCVVISLVDGTSDVTCVVISLVDGTSDVRSVEELCAIDLYKEGRQSSHDHMEMILSACKQIHKAGFLSSILHSKVSQNNRLIIIKCWGLG